MSVATDNVIEAARQSLAMTVEKLASPNDALALAAVATTSLFCDFITASASGAP